MVDGTFKQQNIFSWETKRVGEIHFSEIPSLKLILAADMTGSRCQVPYFFTSPNFQGRLLHPPV